MIRTATWVLMLATCAYADSATQTDWSGGAGFPGVVNTWGNEFDIDSEIAWYTCPGDVSMECVFPVHGIPTGSSPVYNLSTADFDGDGHQDVLSSDFYVLFWLENSNGLGTAWVRHDVVGGSVASAASSAADMDLDGDMDIIASSGYVSDQTFWFENLDGLGTSWQQHVLDDYSPEIEAIHTADIDGDGLPDIVLGGGYGYGCRWYENTGYGATWIEHTIDSYGPGVIDSGDIDGDGDADLFGAFGGFYPIWYENIDGAGLTWQEHILEEAESVWTCAVDDADCDGDLDLFVGGYDFFGWYENTGGGAWVLHNAGPTMNTDVCLVEDLDGDGDPDALACGDGYFDAHLRIFENTGAGDSWVVRGLQADGCQSVAAADIDGSGSLDYMARCDGGQILWWEPDPVDQGWSMLQSSILYLGSDPDWISIDWTADVPPGTTMWFQLRASDDPGQMGGWSEEFYSPGSLAGVLPDSANFLQYRVHFDSSDPWITPVLHDVTFTWNPLGIDEEEPPAALELALPCNPVHGEASIRLGMPEAGAVDLTVYDLAGRQVTASSGMELDAGWQEVALGELPPGVYFVAASSGCARTSERMVMVE